MKTVCISGRVRITLILFIIVIFTLNPKKVFSQNGLYYNAGLSLYGLINWPEEDGISGFGGKLSCGLYLNKFMGGELSIGSYNIKNVPLYMFFGGQNIGIGKFDFSYYPILFNLEFFGHNKFFFFKIGPGYYYTNNPLDPTGGGFGMQIGIELCPIKWLCIELGTSSATLKLHGHGGMSSQLSPTIGKYNYDLASVFLSINIGRRRDAFVRK